MTATGLEVVDDRSFRARVLDHAHPALVLFTAPSCGPCHLQARWLAPLALEFREVLDIVRCPVETSPRTAHRYGIARIPTLMLFRGGVPVMSHVGLWPVPAIRSWVRAALGHDRDVGCEGRPAAWRAVSRPVARRCSGAAAGLPAWLLRFGRRLGARRATVRAGGCGERS